MHVRARLKCKIALYSIALLAFSVVLLLFLHNVSSTITLEDKIYINKILTETGNLNQIKEVSDFDAQIATILAIQNSVFDVAPKTELIPLDAPREPKNLYEARTAYCSDRARTIEKALRLYGFTVRFASIYENTPDKNFVQTLFTKGIEGAHSHAVVEIRTARGWLVIDTRKRWISLDKKGRPHSLRELQGLAVSKKFPKWEPLLKDGMYFLIEDPFYILYGVYSRHGRFYPPYTPYLPDIDFSQFLYNLNDE